MRYKAEEMYDIDCSIMVTHFVKHKNARNAMVAVHSHTAFLHPRVNGSDETSICPWALKQCKIQAPAAIVWSEATLVDASGVEDFAGNAEAMEADPDQQASEFDRSSMVAARR